MDAMLLEGMELLRYGLGLGSEFRYIQGAEEYIIGLLLINNNRVVGVY